MKLIYCPHCHDVVTLRVERERKCECGKSSGRYTDHLYAEIGGDAIPLGFANSSFAYALEKRPRSGDGSVFTAFVIPFECPTVSKQGEKKEVTVVAAQCSNCHDTIYSRHRHDMRWCSCGKIAIDGGRDYTKLTGYISSTAELKLDVSQRDLEQDYLTRADKYGRIPDPNKRTFYLITNTSDYTYWSVKVTKDDTDLTPIERRAVKKYGVIYVNRNGGWFPETCVKKVVKTVVQDDFPDENV